MREEQWFILGSVQAEGGVHLGHHGGDLWIVWSKYRPEELCGLFAFPGFMNLSLP